MRKRDAIKQLKQHHFHENFIGTLIKALVGGDDNKPDLKKLSPIESRVAYNLADSFGGSAHPISGQPTLGNQMGNLGSFRERLESINQQAASLRGTPPPTNRFGR